MPHLSELLDEAVGDQPVRFSTLDVRRRSRQLGVRRRARRVLSAAMAVAVSVGAAVTISDRANRGPNRQLPTAATRAPNTATLPTSTPSPSSTLLETSTTIGTPSPQELLAALQSDRFDASSLPAHLHVLGVGPWQYADAGHVGSGYLGSAQVRLRSDAIGESFASTYDVFGTAAGASAWFTTAYTNFRSYSPAGSVRIPPLDPSVNAFCGPQAAPPDTTTCWFVRGFTTGIVTATIPSSASRGDSDAVLQAMLTHLVALGG